MKAYGFADSVMAADGWVACERCGSSARITNGLCVPCMLQPALDGKGSDGATLAGLLAEIDVRDVDWRICNYQILEEIGRGGMGVIYRARQRHSRRIVALKRLLSYQADSRETLARFRREAEAAASLDHPNILPIYEVGEAEDGLPFFSMKFAVGGSLRDVGAALRSDPRDCVALLAKVSRATEYAHRQGILHRDIKPGNILLDARGEPLVGDFGLAKWLDTETDITRTLTIFGTPGYIAPEQLNGIRNLTPAADVYSVGSVLFDLLAGRPPFLGSHALSVIRQASEKPAPKLRAFCKVADRDLETICAKCLEREPSARYQSAATLAEDLERWLAHRPIRARPVLPSTRAWRWSRRNPHIIATAASCLALGAAAIWFLRSPAEKAATNVPSEKSIAVLPFENLSNDKDNAYFADGIQDEILRRLSKIADLKVISRTSTQQYQSKPGNLSEIAKQLGVAHILEGSVQKNGEAVRVNVQLIKAANESHLWAGTFDRKLTDILSVETDVAKAVADQLRANLTGAEKQVIAAHLTESPEAYRAYLRGLAHTLTSDSGDPDNALRAQKYIREAVRLDPKFAAAWALLSYIDSNGYRTGTLGSTPAIREEAGKAAETALTLQPNLGEALLARGRYYYSCLRDYGTAVHYFEEARRSMPNSSFIPHSLAHVARRQGQRERAEIYFNEAERLDPRNTSLLVDHAVMYVNCGQFAEATRKLDQILDIIPDDPTTMDLKVQIAQAEGDLPRAAELLASGQKNDITTETYQRILERRPAQIIPRLKEILAQPNPALHYYNSERRFWLGWAQEIAGDHFGAQQTWKQTRSELESFLKDQPENTRILNHLALTDMGLGDKAAALDLSEKAVAVNPIDKDAIMGSMSIEVLARVAAGIGEPDRAITTLEKLLSRPFGGSIFEESHLTPALLRLDPMFDSLRGDARFEAMLTSLDATRSRPIWSASAPEETAETKKLRAALVSYPGVELEQWHALKNAAEVSTRLEDGIYEQLSNQSGLPQTLLRTELPQLAKELTRQPAVDPIAAASARYLCKDFNEAERLALQAADKAQKLGDNPGAVRALTLACSAAVKHQEYARALEHAQEADKLSDPERAPTDWLNLQIAVLQLYTQRDDETKAAEQTKNMIEISSRVFGPESIQTARSRDWNGCMLLDQGRGDDAEAEHREAIRLKSKILGPEHPETINSIWVYALTLSNENKSDLALAQYRRVYELRKKVLGPEHRDTLRVRNGIACELALSDPEAAVKEWRDLIETEEKVIGSDDMDTIRSTIYLGNILGCNLHRFAEAESLLRAGVAHADKLLKSSSRSPGDFWFVEGMRLIFAAGFYEAGHFAEAEALERESLHACEQTVGPEGDSLPLIRKMLAAALDAQGKHREAEEQLRQVAVLLAKGTNPNSADVELAGMSVANMLEQGRALEAEAEARKLIPVAEKKLGSRAYTRDANRSDFSANSCVALGTQSPLVCRMLLANALRDQKKYQEAEAEYRSVIEQQEKIIGTEDRFTLESYYNFAYHLAQQGRLTQAKTFAKQALDRAPRSYGPGHPVTRRYRVLLGMIETGQPITMAEAKFRDSLLAAELPKQATR